jgi:actin related protein 2/3 complex subunit 4
MSNTLRPYLSCVRSSLTAALVLSNFASQVVERHNVPEVEAATSRELLLTPLRVARNESEHVLIEPSANSVRFSIRIKQADEIERIVCHKLTRFLMLRAEGFVILRRKPVPVSAGRSGLRRRRCEAMRRVAAGARQGHWSIAGIYDGASSLRPSPESNRGRAAGAER